MSPKMLVCVVLCVILHKTFAATNATSESIDRNSQNETSVYQLSWMSSLFNHHGWSLDYLRNSSGICKKHAAEYIKELNKGTSWASKSEYCFVITVNLNRIL